jgi:hypothetical protein
VSYFQAEISVSDLFLARMVKWFASINLVRNLDKTNIMKFITKNSSHSAIQFDYKEEYLAEH